MSHFPDVSASTAEGHRGLARQPVDHSSHVLVQSHALKTGEDARDVDFLELAKKAHAASRKEIPASDPWSQFDAIFSQNSLQRTETPVSTLSAPAPPVRTFSFDSDDDTTASGTQENTQVSTSALSRTESDETEESQSKGRDGVPTISRDRRQSVLKQHVTENLLPLMTHGHAMLKYGRHGQPHFRYFQLRGANERRWLQWYSPNKHLYQTKIPLPHMIKVLHGQHTDVFRKNKPDPVLEPLSFSLLYIDPEDKTRTRTLDLIALSYREYLIWTLGLSKLIEWERKYESDEAPPGGPQNLEADLEASDRPDVPHYFWKYDDVPHGSDEVEDMRKEVKKAIKHYNNVVQFARNSRETSVYGILNELHDRIIAVRNRIKNGDLVGSHEELRRCAAEMQAIDERTVACVIAHQEFNERL
ncbi:MAG: hypothetical protein MHM6MM_003303 [Cercozoa sp. M6MM]